MSNHSGSYMLNGVIELMFKQGIFEALGKEKSQQLVVSIVKASYQYDCNPGEILEDVGEQIGICYYCLKPAEHFQDGVCIDCRKEW